MKNLVSNIIVFFGPPGTGKGTLAQNFSRVFSCKHISTGSLCRRYASKNDDLGMIIAEKINNGHLIEDGLMIDLLIKDLTLGNDQRKTNCIILDGFPRTIDQARLLLHMLGNKIKNFKLILFVFDLSDQIIIDRLSARIICSNNACDIVYSLKNYKKKICQVCGSSLFVRLDDEDKNKILFRLKIYHETKTDIIKFLSLNAYSTFNIDAHMEPEILFNSFLSNVNNVLK